MLVWWGTLPGKGTEKDLGVELLSPSAQYDAVTRKAGKALYV